MSDCRRCVERGQTWDGDPPKCAFRSGAFNSDNWNCASLVDVRLSRQANSFWNDDQNLAVYPFDCGRFLILGWYKSRGRTEVAIVVDECDFRPATLEDVEAVLMPPVEEAA